MAVTPLCHRIRMTVIRCLVFTIRLLAPVVVRLLRPLQSPLVARAAGIASTVSPADTFSLTEQEPNCAVHSMKALAPQMILQAGANMVSTNARFAYRRAMGRALLARSQRSTRPPKVKERRVEVKVRKAASAKATRIGRSTEGLRRRLSRTLARSLVKPPLRLRLSPRLAPRPLRLALLRLHLRMWARLWLALRRPVWTWWLALRWCPRLWRRPRWPAPSFRSSPVWLAPRSSRLLRQLPYWPALSLARCPRGLRVPHFSMGFSPLLRTRLILVFLESFAFALVRTSRQRRLKFGSCRLPQFVRNRPLLRQLHRQNLCFRWLQLPQLVRMLLGRSAPMLFMKVALSPMLTSPGWHRVGAFFIFMQARKGWRMPLLLGIQLVFRLTQST